MIYINICLSFCSHFVQKSRSARPRPENLSLTIFPSRPLTDILAIHFLFVLYCICMCIVQTSRPLTDILAIHLDIWLLLLVLFRVQSFCLTTDIFKIHFICFCWSWCYFRSCSNIKVLYKSSYHLLCWLICLMLSLFLLVLSLNQTITFHLFPHHKHSLEPFSWVHKLE